MLIAHLPAGYIIGNFSRKHSGALSHIQWAAVLIGSVIPDIDMIWFWTVDHRQHHHHGYFTHWPIFWFGVWLLARGLSYLKPQSFSERGVNLYGLGVLSHMVMDSIAAPIMWFAPFSARWIELMHVPASPNGALFALTTHWTFALELMICAYAIWLVLSSMRQATASQVD